MKKFNPLQALRISGPLFTALAMLTGCASTDEPAQDSVVKVGDQGVGQQWETSDCWGDSEQCQLASDCVEGGGTWEDGQCVVEVTIDWEQDCENEGGEWDATNEECAYPGNEASDCEDEGGAWNPDLGECTSEEQLICEEHGGTWDGSSCTNENEEGHCEWWPTSTFDGKSTKRGYDHDLTLGAAVSAARKEAVDKCVNYQGRCAGVFAGNGPVDVTCSLIDWVMGPSAGYKCDAKADAYCTWKTKE